MSRCPSLKCSGHTHVTPVACRHVSWFVSWIENENQPVGGTRIETEIQPLHTISRAGAFPHIREALASDGLKIDNLRNHTTDRCCPSCCRVQQVAPRLASHRVPDPLVPDLVSHGRNGLEIQERSNICGSGVPTDVCACRNCSGLISLGSRSHCRLSAITVA